MAELRPLEEPRQVCLEFTYNIDQAWINKMIDDEGVRPSSKWKVEFDLSEVASADLRRRLRLAWEHYGDSEDYPVLPSPTEDPVEFAEQYERWRTSTELEKAAEEKEAKKTTEIQKAESAAFAEEMSSWVAEHGSKRLKVAVERNYKSNRTYARERAAAEFPEFWVDTAEHLEWEERVDPSEEALDLEVRVRESIKSLGLDSKTDTRIVWLTEAPGAVDEILEEAGEVFEPQEAIVVSPYLHRYALAMPVDENHRVRVEADD
ncbi:MAG TPA: hypothetical protein VGB06_01510 [Solirubrobacterales bacterium]|jgi:hypothetical protein